MHVVFSDEVLGHKHSGPIESFLPQSLAYAYCGIRWFLVMPADVSTFSSSFMKREMAQNVVPLTSIDQGHLEFLRGTMVTALPELW